jgi:ubiquinone/menaquinone biosynthesis C-methylase UbiE
MSVVDYTVITELAGDEVSQEQVDRSNRRYWWAGEFCTGRDVLEVGCGVAQGVGYLQRVAKSVSAGDYSEDVLAYARKHYGDRIAFKQFDAQEMPYADASMDVVLIFEASYYVPDIGRFFNECRRVLRPGGVLLVANANKDLFDFNPSPNSFRYLGVNELRDELSPLGFTCSFFGDVAVAEVSARQQLLRPIKLVVSRLGLMPKTNNTKKLLKRFVFGKLVPLPAEVLPPTGPWQRPTPIPADRADTQHKVVLCVAKL